MDDWLAARDSTTEAKAVMFGSMFGRKRDFVTKADRGVKTAEAWWAFANQLWEARGFFTPIFALALGMTAALREVFTVIAGYGWAGWILAGVPTFILAALIWFGLSWVWYLRPGNARRLANIKSIEEVERFDVNDTLQRDYDLLKQEVDRLSLKTDATSTALDATFQIISNVNTSMATINDPITDYVNGLRDAISDRITGIEEVVSSLSASVDQFKCKVFHVLISQKRLAHVERLHSILSEQFGVLEVIRSVNAEKQNDTAWASNFLSCKSIMEDYEAIARDVDPTLPSALSTNAEDYKAERWTFDQSDFLNHDLMHDFKSYRLIKLQFEALHSLVLDRLRRDTSI